MSVAVLVLAALVAGLLTGAIRRYSVHRRLVDEPNARSSHTVATPRGGGLAIVLVVLAGLLVLHARGALESELLMALFGGGAVAVLGFVDDHGHVPARWRLLGHFIAALWALVWLGGSPAVEFLEVSLHLGWLGHALALVYLVWMLNLYNFMDGIDGIAALEAITVCVAASFCYLLAGRAAGAAELLLAAAACGFLVWNFPRAWIFMGDVGSGFIGITLGILALHAAWQEPRLLWCWLILPAIFVTDATFTLLRRLQRGDAVHQAHRSHAYQIAVRRCGRHVPVTLAITAINIGWLAPLALAVASGWGDGFVTTLIAYLPLLGLAIGLGAGSPEQTN